MRNAYTNILVILFIITSYGWKVQSEKWPNMGTVLFTRLDTANPTMEKSRVALLQARKHLHTLVPLPDFITYDSNYVQNLLSYFRDAFLCVKEQSHDPEVDKIMTTALSDIVGGYMKQYMLPVTKTFFYGGLVSYDDAEKVFHFYDEVKRYLNTDGNSWWEPDESVLDNIPIATQRLPRDKCKGMIEPCNNFAYLEKTTDGLEIPMPAINWGEETMFVPYKNESSFSLKSPKYTHALKNYYDNAECCVQSMSPEAEQKFNDKFQNWLLTGVLPRLYSDSNDYLYGALGNVLNLLNKTESTCEQMLINTKNKLYSNPKQSFLSKLFKSKTIIMIAMLLLIECIWCICVVRHVIFNKKMNKSANEQHTSSYPCSSRRLSQVRVEQGIISTSITTTPYQAESGITHCTSCSCRCPCIAKTKRQTNSKSKRELGIEVRPRSPGKVSEFACQYPSFNQNVGKEGASYRCITESCTSPHQSYQQMLKDQNIPIRLKHSCETYLRKDKLNAYLVNSKSNVELEKRWSTETYSMCEDYGVEQADLGADPLENSEVTKDNQVTEIPSKDKVLDSQTITVPASDDLTCVKILGSICPCTNCLQNKGISTNTILTDQTCQTVVKKKMSNATETQVECINADTYLSSQNLSLEKALVKKESYSPQRLYRPKENFLKIRIGKPENTEIELGISGGHGNLEQLKVKKTNVSRIPKKSRKGKRDPLPPAVKLAITPNNDQTNEQKKISVLSAAISAPRLVEATAATTYSELVEQTNTIPSRSKRTSSTFYNVTKTETADKDQDTSTDPKPRHGILKYYKKHAKIKDSIEHVAKTTKVFTVKRGNTVVKKDNVHDNNTVIREEGRGPVSAPKPMESLEPTLKKKSGIPRLKKSSAADDTAIQDKKGTTENNNSNRLNLTL